MRHDSGSANDASASFVGDLELDDDVRKILIRQGNRRSRRGSQLKDRSLNRKNLSFLGSGE